LEKKQKAMHQKLLEEFHTARVDPLHRMARGPFVYKSWHSLDHDKCTLDELNVDTIANTLTTYCFALFKRVQPLEHLAWLKGKKGDSKNVKKLVDFFNYLSNWTSKEIVMKPKLIERVESFEKLALVACGLFERKNFLCMYAIISGLTSSPVQRMKRTLEEVKRRNVWDVWVVCVMCVSCVCHVCIM